MDGHATSGILCAFRELPDPRQKNHRHLLMDILTIALLAVICGADNWSAVAAYRRAKHQWLKTFLQLPNGIPSHDTLGETPSDVSLQSSILTPSKLA